ncbi:hypothetical protein [Mitsuaria sp. 7]|uniref:hypothetical protein n=1 Tax=Mitsuaria sp. 7 TaxID=1658665 RepID=UPI0012FA15EC|nr:hypothetical protein [Mitsuaria sp. 7]
MSIRSIVAVACVFLAHPLALAQTHTPASSISLAKQATRCSVVFGMGAAAERSADAKADLENLQRSLMRVAAKLGGTHTSMEGWLQEFDGEFKSATALSEESGKRMREEAFMPRQIDICNGFLREHGAKLEGLLRQ